MAAEQAPTGTFYMDPACLRVAANDPGTVNNGMCLIELIGVSHVIGIDGPRTRTPIPRFVVLEWAVMNLEEPAVPNADAVDTSPEAGRLHEVQCFLSHESTLGTNMPTWRRHMVQQLHYQWPILDTPYKCGLTGRMELPVLARENQLDVSADARHREELDKMEEERKKLRAFRETQLTTANAQLLDTLDYFCNFKKLTVRNDNEFNTARMYTLSEVLATCVSMRDIMDDAKRRSRRVVINAAKKHAIASDKSLSYYMRKKRSVEHVRWLFERQCDAPDVTPAERANGIKWLAFMDKMEANGQKLDDLCDALLLAIEQAMRIHKKWYKRIVARDPGAVLPVCYRPVTNADMEAAREVGTLAVNPVLTEPEVPRPKYARKKPAAPRKRKLAAFMDDESSATAPIQALPPAPKKRRIERK